MPSLFTWVDIDETSRRKMLDVVQMFRDQDTVDELGLGTIRDAFANYFFPGTSTIQTRACYFLFIPWIYRRLEIKQTPSSKIASVARESELDLLDALIEAGAGENEGVIGIISGRKLQRLPSNIYWVGLHEWHIRRFPRTQDQYHRYLDTFYKKKQTHVLTDDKEPVAGHIEHNWDPHLPQPPNGFPRGATMSLRREDAKYLQDRISAFIGDTLLAAMVNAPQFQDSDYLWDNAVVLTVPEHLQNQVKHSHKFALSAYGAVLLYNLMLSRARKNDDWIEDYSEKLKEWVSKINKSWQELSHWNQQIRQFWNCKAFYQTNIPSSTKNFVEAWNKLILEDSLSDKIADNRDAHELIKMREVHLKRQRARLENDRYLEMWNGASGAAMINYRWYQVKRIVQDIRHGIARRA